MLIVQLAAVVGFALLITAAVIYKTMTGQQSLRRSSGGFQDS
jgi:hypothetical protein